MLLWEVTKTYNHLGGVDGSTALVQNKTQN